MTKRACEYNSYQIIQSDYKRAKLYNDNIETTICNLNEELKIVKKNIEDLKNIIAQLNNKLDKVINEKNINNQNRNTICSYIS